jgi:hypothetical protein
LVKERLIRGDIHAIIGQLHRFEFGEHNILVYPDYETLRDLYSQHCRIRLKEGNEIVLLLPHYETINSVREALRELDIDVAKHEQDNTLVIMDAITTMFNPTTDDFRDYLMGLENRARATGKSGICIIADMGSFYHLGKLDEMISYEVAIPPKRQDVKSSLLCVYHSKDFERLSKEHKELICRCHYREIQLNSLPP